MWQPDRAHTLDFQFNNAALIKIFLKYLLEIAHKSAKHGELNTLSLFLPENLLKYSDGNNFF